MFAYVSMAVPQIKGGNVRALAVAGAHRNAALPDVPTLAESGFPGFDTTAWMGVVGPARLPADIVSRLNSEVGKAVSSRDLNEVYVSQGAVPEVASPGVFAEMIRREYTYWGAVVRQIGAKPD